MADNTELTEDLLDYEEDEQQAPAAEEQAAGDTKKVKGCLLIKYHLWQLLLCSMFCLLGFIIKYHYSFVAASTMFNVLLTWLYHQIVSLFLVLQVPMCPSTAQGSGIFS